MFIIKQSYVHAAQCGSVCCWRISLVQPLYVTANNAVREIMDVFLKDWADFLQVFNFAVNGSTIFTRQPP